MTLEEDVWSRLEQLRRERHMNLKQAINTALRAGLDRLESPQPTPDAAYRITPVRLGAKLKDLDNIAEVLAVSEGECHR